MWYMMRYFCVTFSCTGLKKGCSPPSPTGAINGNLRAVIWESKKERKEIRANERERETVLRDEEGCKGGWRGREGRARNGEG